MKKLNNFFSLLCLCGGTLLTAQNSYHSVFTPNTHWELYKLDEQFKGSVVKQQTIKDTTFNGNTYKVFGEKSDVSPNKKILVRENVAEKKVYVFDDGKEFLLYDFNLVVGEKFYIRQWELEVVSVGTMKTAEGERKCIELKPISKAWDNIKWVEGLGSMVGPIYYQNYGKLEESFQVTCFFRDNNLIYSASDWNCMNPANTTAIVDPADLAKKVMVAPNPFRDQFQVMVNNPSGGDITMSITTLTGVRIYEEKFEKAEEKFQTTLGWSSDIFNGLLLLKVQTSEGQIIKRIVKE